jgi:O-acetyl-ADP-ribose deacetylase (regulator of RNase III)
VCCIRQIKDTVTLDYGDTMIFEVEGDITLSGANAVAHVVAPNDEFKTGFAHSLRESWPALYKDFRHYCRQEHPKTGEVWAWKGAGSATIYNLMVQEAATGHSSHPGKATVPALNKALGELRQLCDKEKFKTLAMTRLATGVGGLEWNEVQPLIEKHFKDSSMRVYVYKTYRPKVKAVED